MRRPTSVQPLRDIQTNGRHLLRLINAVLDLSKIEAGRMELSLADYAVADVVALVHSSLRSLAAEKGLAFVTTCRTVSPRRSATPAASRSA